MCLITKQKRVFITKEDMKVFKALEYINKYTARAIFNEFDYEYNKRYDTTIELSDDICFADITSQHHYFKLAGKKVDEVKEVVKKLNLFVYGQGFHGALTFERLHQEYEDDDIFEAIIPKGAKYFLDATGLFVSSSIIIINKRITA